MKKHIHILIIVSSLLAVACSKSAAQFPIGLRGSYVENYAWNQLSKDYTLIDSLKQPVKLCIDERKIGIKRDTFDWLEKGQDLRMTTVTKDGNVTTYWHDEEGRSILLEYDSIFQSYDVFYYQDFDVMTNEFNRLIVYRNCMIDESVIDEKEKEQAAEKTTTETYLYSGQQDLKGSDVTMTALVTASNDRVLEQDAIGKTPIVWTASKTTIVFKRNAIEQQVTLIKANEEKLYFTQKRPEKDIYLDRDECKSFVFVDSNGKYGTIYIYKNPYLGVAIKYEDLLWFFRDTKT